MQEKLVGNNYYLNKSAKDAYRSYILAYNSHSMKDIFNVHRLDMQVRLFVEIRNIAKIVLYPFFPFLTSYEFTCSSLFCRFWQAVAASLCFSNPPKVNVNIDSSASKFRKKTRKVEGSRHGFSSSNPYGNRK